MFRFAIFLAFLAAAALYAYRRGGTPEKQIAAILVGIQLFDIGYHEAGGESGYLTVDAWHSFNDLWALAAVLVVALRADRFWPLWIAALQLIAASSHLVRYMDLAVPPMAYAIMIRVPIWLQVLFLVVGTWNYARRAKGSREFTI